MEHFSVGNIDVYMMPLPEKMARKKAEAQAKEKLLHEVLGSDVQLTYTEEGKPLLPDCFISISHSKHHLCVALSKEQEVGIDVEEIQPRFSRLLTYYLQPYEVDACKGKLALATRCWSAKEAIYKIVGKEAGATGKKIHIEAEHLEDKTFFAVCRERRFRLQVLVDNFLHQVVLATEVKQ